MLRTFLNKKLWHRKWQFFNLFWCITKKIMTRIKCIPIANAWWWQLFYIWFLSNHLGSVNHIFYIWFLPNPLCLVNHMCQSSDYRWLTHETFEITHWPTFLIILTEVFQLQYHWTLLPRAKWQRIIYCIGFNRWQAIIWTNDELQWCICRRQSTSLNIHCRLTLNGRFQAIKGKCWFDEIWIQFNCFIN